MRGSRRPILAVLPLLFQGTDALFEVGGFEQLAIHAGIGGHGRAGPQAELRRELAVKGGGEVSDGFTHEYPQLEQIKRFSVPLPWFSSHTLPPCSIYLATSSGLLPLR
jgi:hypothetical protein